MIGPRNTPPRAEKYIGLALFLRNFSKDPRTQHGAVIVTVDNEPLGMGYNGPPKQINDNKMNWDRPDKYPLIDHAERNAIDHSDKVKLPGSIIYVTGKPCEACMLDIVKNNIKTVVYLDSLEPNEGVLRYGKTEWIAELGGVKLVPFRGNKINMGWIQDWTTELGEQFRLFD